MLRARFIKILTSELVLGVLIFFASIFLIVVPLLIARQLFA